MNINAGVKERLIININKKELNNKIYLLTKRGIDIIGSLIGCIILIPITLCVWIANIINKEYGPIFYAHDRIGKDGKSFKMYKFRTMHKNANEIVQNEEKMTEYFTQEQIEEWKTNFKIKDDPRITKLGRFLRKTSMDELPQVINILKGDLSIVGPRPIVKDELEMYEHNKGKFLSIKPGLTGYWAANGRSNISYEERMEMELYYVDNFNLKLDIIIIIKTIVTVLKCKGSE